MEPIILPKATCIRCGGSWVPRKTEIKQCPKCHSNLWNKPRIYKKRVCKPKM